MRIVIIPSVFGIATTARRGLPDLPNLGSWAVGAGPKMGKKRSNYSLGKMSETRGRVAPRRLEIDYPGAIHPPSL